jgi:hypothetical protein
MMRILLKITDAVMHKYNTLSSITPLKLSRKNIYRSGKPIPIIDAAIWLRPQLKPIPSTLNKGINKMKDNRSFADPLLRYTQSAH